MHRYTQSEPETVTSGGKALTVISEIPELSVSEREEAMMLAVGKIRRILKPYESREGKRFTSGESASRR